MRELREKRIGGRGCAQPRISPPPVSVMARGVVEWSFYSWERTLAFLAFIYALYAYGPPNVPPLWQNERGVLVNFSEPDVKIAGIAYPFLFGLATAPAHVEDQARKPSNTPCREEYVTRCCQAAFDLCAP